MDDISKFGLIKDTLWHSEIGKIIGPIKIQDLYGIFKVLEKKNGLVIPFQEKKNEAERLAKVEKSRQIMDEYLIVIKPKVNVKINEQLLAAIPINN